MERDFHDGSDEKNVEIWRMWKCANATARRWNADFHDGRDEKNVEICLNVLMPRHNHATRIFMIYFDRPAGTAGGAAWNKMVMMKYGLFCVLPCEGAIK